MGDDCCPNQATSISAVTSSGGHPGTVLRDASGATFTEIQKRKQDELDAEMLEYRSDGLREAKRYNTSPVLMSLEALAAKFLSRSTPSTLCASTIGTRTTWQRRS